MTKIFISYRRDDSKQAAGRLHAALEEHFHRKSDEIFIDVDNVPKGVDFAQHVNDRIAECDVVLVLIGKNWLELRDAGTGLRRLDDPSDYVRLEVAAGLRRGIPVVPVLVDGAKLPGANQLPESIRELATRNGGELRHERFGSDVTGLVEGLPLRGKAARPRAVRRGQQSFGRRVFIGVALGLVATAVGFGAIWGTAALQQRNEQHQQDAIASPQPPQPSPSSGTVSTMPSVSASPMLAEPPTVHFRYAYFQVGVENGATIIPNPPTLVDSAIEQFVRQEAGRTDPKVQKAVAITDEPFAYSQRAGRVIFDDDYTICRTLRASLVNNCAGDIGSDVGGRDGHQMTYNLAVPQDATCHPVAAHFLVILVRSDQQSLGNCAPQNSRILDCRGGACSRGRGVAPF